MLVPGKYERQLMIGDGFEEYIVLLLKVILANDKHDYSSNFKNISIGISNIIIIMKVTVYQEIIELHHAIPFKTSHSSFLMYNVN